MPRHVWNDPRPFALGPASSRVGCLLVHGFTGSPVEMRPLGEATAAAGYRSIGVQLPGHGTEVAALDGIHRHDWLEAVRDGRRWLEESCDEVVLIGLSMGALLVTVEAARQPPAALILLAPAFRIANPLIKLAPWFGWLPGSIPAPAESGLTSVEGWKSLWHYERRPIRAARELHALSQQAGEALEAVSCPTLVIQGALDKSIDPQGARRAFDRLAVAEKRFVWLERSGHIVTADVEAERVFEETLRFILSATA